MSKKCHDDMFDLGVPKALMRNFGVGTRRYVRPGILPSFRHVQSHQGDHRKDWWDPNNTEWER